MRVLTFDIEEWFHILDNDSTKTHDKWNNYESRIHMNMDKILALLKKHNQKATFFCLGWIAMKYPEVIKRIADNGYEIGSHSTMHQLVYEQNEDSFHEDLKKSIDVLESISGQKVRYFRAPGFSITEKNKWAFEVLVRNDIELDCSIFPAARAHGGFPSYYSPKPSFISYNGLKIKEMPINYVKILGNPLIFSGGGYFRLFPYSLIKRWTKQSEYLMTYMHPRDFDPGQPIIKELSRFRKFKSYTGLKSSFNKFEKWLTDFNFTDIGTAEKEINWDKVPVINL